MSRPIRVAIAGVGNCASAFVQGVHYYRKARDEDFIPGLAYVNFGGYRVCDIEFAAAFDVNVDKVGKDLSEAIFTPPNNTRRFAHVPKLGVEVMKGPVLDSVGRYLGKVVPIDVSKEPVDVANVLKDSGADMLINYLPVGSEKAAYWYAEKALEAGCAFINAMPVFIASSLEWQKRFMDKGLPVAGDDVQSQIGSTVLHKSMIKMLVDRGVKVERTWQLNWGGDTDFLNMLERERLAFKEVSKTEAVKAMAPYSFEAKIGPAEYVPFLENRKYAHIMIEGRYFGDTPLRIVADLEVWDAPNSAGVMVDVVRAVKIALDRGVAGPLISICSWAFKYPPAQAPYELARQWVEDFIAGRRER